MPVGVAGVAVEDLLPAGDGLQEEAALRVVVRGLEIGVDGPRDGAALLLVVAELEPEAHVLGVLGEDLNQELGRLGEAAPRGQALGVRDRLVLIYRQSERLTS